MGRTGWPPAAGQAGAALLALGLLCCRASALLSRAGASEPIDAVVPCGQTEPMPDPGDAAAADAIWVDASDPARSMVIGTNKQGGAAGRGLIVYDLAGQERQRIGRGDMNNVDLRDGFPLRGERVSLVAASNRTDGSIALFAIDPSTHTLREVAARAIRTGLAVYGSCLYHSHRTGRFYFFVANHDGGPLQQWELFDSGAGRVDARLLRTITNVTSQAEGMVADDEEGVLYVGEEDVGIWEYGAEPTDSPSARRLVDRTGRGGYLVRDVEGLALALEPGGRGYLVASSQGESRFAVYRRERNAAGGHDLVKKFAVVAAGGVDEVTETDGLDVTAAPVGPRFPHGLLVVQDGSAPGGRQNFKLVSWDQVVPGATPLACLP